jgi:hypothetical protein
MGSEKKTAQLQIRISRRDKARLVRAAHRADKDLSTYVLDACLPSRRGQFEEVLASLRRADDASFALAELADLLTGLSRGEFERVVHPRPELDLDPRAANFVAAMIEHRAGVVGARVPAWTADIDPLDRPYFATDLVGLRAHLLVSSPPAYRRRNLFVDAVVGDRV